MSSHKWAPANSFPSMADRWCGCSESLDRAEWRKRSQTRDDVDEQSLTMEDDVRPVGHQSTCSPCRQKGIHLHVMVDFRATSDYIRANSNGMFRPPSTSWLHLVCTVLMVQTWLCSHWKDGPDEVTWLANKMPFKWGVTDRNRSYVATCTNEIIAKLW